MTDKYIPQKTLKRLGIWALVVASILLIPLVAKWPWTGMDFIVGAALLFGSATAYELVTRNIGNATKRSLIGIGIGVVLAAIWVLLATG